ncbi:MAG: TolC family protein [Kofleriaceae bacterium]
MFDHGCARATCAALLFIITAAAHAEPLTIDLSTALDRARQRAPEALAAIARLEQAEAHRAGSAMWFSHNLELEAGIGPRWSDPPTLQIEGRISQQLEPGRRSARIAAADAVVENARAVNEDQLRRLGYEVVIAWNEARHADLLVELATRNHELAVQAADAATRRRKAGDITDLDLNLATVAAGRARAAVAGARAERAAAIGRLGVLIGATASDVITLSGDLRPRDLTLDMLTTALPRHAQLRALASEAKLAAAEARVARTNRWPDLGVWIGYERDDRQAIVIGGLAVTLPLWNRAQGEQASARAHQRQVSREQALVTRNVSRQVVDAFEAYARTREAVAVFERDVLPPLGDSELLLERSVTTGQLAIGDYLVARQEILNGRRDHLDRLLALARSAAHARFLAGVSP